MKDILNQLIEHKTLDRATAREVLLKLTQGAYNGSQIAAFITVYLMRNITVDELMGFREAMLEQCLAVDLSAYDTMDLCGTGGDGKDTFNISTLSAFVVAGAGQAVAKHGNYGVSSACGSSNLLQHFGYSFTQDFEVLEKSLEQANICFLHAPLFHPAMKNVGPIRRELGVKTFFNMLGPMVNPANPQKQLVGVFSLELARLYAYLYQSTDKQYAIVHALDGYDEVSLTGAVKVYSSSSERLLQPKDFYLPELKEEQLFGGGTIEEAAAIFERVLRGEGTQAQEAAVLANAGMALHVAKDCSLAEGVELARTSLRSGKALETFRTLVGDKKKTSVQMG
jgi:anthranilate phosphoribosyltransferase